MLPHGSCCLRCNETNVQAASCTVVGCDVVVAGMGRRAWAVVGGRGSCGFYDYTMRVMPSRIWQHIPVYLITVLCTACGTTICTKVETRSTGTRPPPAACKLRTTLPAPCPTHHGHAAPRSLCRVPTKRGHIPYTAATLLRHFCDTSPCACQTHSHHSTPGFSCVGVWNEI